MTTKKVTRDPFDLSEFRKNSTKFAVLNNPLVFAVGTVVAVLLGLSMFNLNLLIALCISIFFGGVVYLALDTTDNGYSLLAIYTVGAYKKWMSRRSDTTQALNYCNLEYKERKKEYKLWQKIALYFPMGYRLKNKATVHVARIFGVLGAKENLIKTANKRRWIALYDVIIDSLPTTTEEEKEIDENIQNILNILHNRKIKSKVFFTKNKLTKNDFEKYFKDLSKKTESKAIEELKKKHISEVKEMYLNTVKNSNIKLTLAIDVEIPFRFLSDGLSAWNKAKNDLEIIQKDIDIFKNIKIVKKTNFDLKTFISELTNPLNSIDPRKMFIDEEIKEIEELEIEDEQTEEEEKKLFEKIKIYYLNLKKKLGVYTLSHMALNDLREDVLFYLPDSVVYDETKEEVKIEDYKITNMVIPTTNRLLSDEIVKFLLTYKEVYNVVFNLETINKSKVIQKLEQKEYNEQSNFLMRQNQKRLGTNEKRTIEGVTDYVDFISSDNAVEMYNIIITFGIATNKNNLKQITQIIREEVYSRFGIKAHKALFNQQELHGSSLFRNSTELDRYKFLTDSSRIPKITPISSYTFKDEKGFLLGTNKDSGEPAFFDADSAKTESRAKFIFAPTGYGKSTLLKMLATRTALQGYSNIILDLTGEYSARLGKSLDMKIFKIGGANGSKINPFELFSATDFESEELISKHIQRLLIPVFSILLSDLEFNDGLMDKVFHDFYKRKSKKNMKSFVKFLNSYIKKIDGEKEILLNRYITELERYTEYSLKNVFGDSNDFNNLDKYKNIIFDISELDSTKGAGDKKHIASVMHIVIANLWLISEANEGEDQTFVTIDEGHRLTKTEQTAEFLAMLVKEGRRERMSLIIASQDPSDFFNSKSGTKIIDNIPTRFYSGLNNVPEKYMKALSINPNELEEIKKLNPGEFLLKRREEKMFVKIELSETEKQLCDTTHSYYKK